MNACHYCNETFKPAHLRPYGPGGSLVCFPCATASPEREAELKANFSTLLGAAAAVSPVGVAAIGTPAGPMAFNPGAPEGADEPQNATEDPA